jgi:hypothetical protein
MAKSFAALFGLTLFCSSVVPALAQIPQHPTATVTAPASLACDATGTATLDVRTPHLPMELFLVIDESGSIPSTTFQNQVKGFMRNIVQGLSMGPDAARVGIVQFSTTARLMVGLNASKASVLNTITGSTQQAGNTCIGCGVALADQQLQANARPGVPRFMVVMTDGANNRETDTFASVVSTAKANGAVIFAVGVANYLASELAMLASTIPGQQTVLTVTNFNGLSTLINSILQGFPNAQVTGPRVDLTISPEFAVVSAASEEMHPVTVTGNVVVWTPQNSGRLQIQLRRVTATPGTAQLFTATDYGDAQGRVYQLPNATITLPECTVVPPDEAEQLRAQIAALTARVAELESELAALTVERGALVDRVAALQVENDALRQQLAGGAAPTGTGAMNGSGQVVAGRTRNVFELTASKMSDGNLKLALTFKVCEQLPEQADDDLACLNRLHRLSVTYFTAVQFSDDLSFGAAGDSAQAGVDTLVLSGIGSWDGVDGHRFTVTATDRGDGAGPNTDTFQIEITNPAGTIVATVLGTLVTGNVEVK